MGDGLSLSFLGTFEVWYDGAEASDFESDKARALLAYLAVESDRAHRRDALAELFWPDFPSSRARRNLNQAVLNLRDTIGDREAEPPFLLSDRQTLGFNPDADFYLDVADFEQLLVACRRHDHPDASTCAACMERRARAVDLYRGDFMRGLNVEGSANFDDWIAARREGLHRSAIDALAVLSTYFEQRWELDRARWYSRRQIEMEPWREAAHMQLMRLLAHGGDYGAALKQYRQLEEVLEEEFGVPPGEAAQQLRRRIHAVWSQPERRALPAPSGDFVGREAERAEAALLLAQPTRRLLTITGPGGVGKTRLALAAAAQKGESFADGAHFVDLQPIETAGFLSAIADALPISLSGRQPPRVQFIDYLRD
ncbi:MAG: BTAD domain-containing putative transcriptional regulator, partial [Candidatus Promineifilaceae bacterium]|nr:BTAD domain-containing putative transcriptional regulator [Candidatus Promineifilaceae bacterium]